MGWLCVHMYIFKVKRFSLFYLVGRLVDLCAVIMLLFAVSLFFIPFFPFYSHSCYAFPPPSLYVRAIRNINNRTRNDFTRQNEQELWMRYNEQKQSVCVLQKKLLRESRLTWKNSSRNIWIEICVNGCECECDVLNQLKLQLVQSLKTYSSYVPFVFHNYSHCVQ